MKHRVEIHLQKEDSFMLKLVRVKRKKYQKYLVNKKETK